MNRYVVDSQHGTVIVEANDPATAARNAAPSLMLTVGETLEVEVSQLTDEKPRRLSLTATLTTGLSS